MHDSSPLNARTVLGQRFHIHSFGALVRRIILSLYYLVFAKRAYRFAVRPLLEFNNLSQLRLFCNSYPIFENCMPIRLDVKRSLGDRLMVIAPHPDDDTIGAGGTIIQALRDGKQVLVVYITDGGTGGPHAYSVNAATRMHEAAQLATILGYRHQVLGAPDGEFPITAKLAADLSRSIQAFSPDAIFVPWLLEGHPCHRQVNRLFLRSLTDQPVKAAVFAYQVWSQVPANTFVDITNVMNAKLEAIQRWESQLELFDYVNYTRGMNAFSSYLQSGRGYVEPFFNLPSEEYVELLRHYYPQAQ